MKKGFTLIELLVVVLIVGILAAVALPQYQMAVEKARATEAMINVKALAEASELYYLANGDYPFSSETLDSEGLKALDIEIKRTKNFIIRTHFKAYVAMVRTGSPSVGYMISQGLNNHDEARLAKRGLTCSTDEFSDSNSISSKICKNLCGTSTLTMVWGSGQFGCSMKK